MSSCGAGAAAAAGGDAACCDVCASAIRLDVRREVRLATLLAGIIRVPSFVRLPMNPSSPRVGRRELFGLFGGNQSDLDEIERADEVSGDGETACADDGVTEPDRPAVLEQDERGGGVVRELLEDVPGLFLVDHVDAICCGLGAGDRTGLHALLAARSETEEPADHGAELHRLVLGELAALQYGDLTLRILEDDERVDHAHRIALAQPFELVDDLAPEIGLVEPEHQQLNRSDRHVPSPSLVTT